MTGYLLDENVLRECHPRGHPQVGRWLATIDDHRLFLSVMTLFEKRQGAERLRLSAPDKAAAILAAIDAVEQDYRDRILPIDRKVAAEWSKLLGRKQKNQRDRALAATARVHGLIVATRNIGDFAGCDVDVVNPFSRQPKIQRL